MFSYLFLLLLQLTFVSSEVHDITCQWNRQRTVEDLSMIVPEGSRLRFSSHQGYGMPWSHYGNRKVCYYEFEVIEVSLRLIKAVHCSHFLLFSEAWRPLPWNEHLLSKRGPFGRPVLWMLRRGLSKVHRQLQHIPAQVRFSAFNK